MLQHVQKTKEAEWHQPVLLGHSCPALFRWQSKALREEWWPSHRSSGTSAKAPAGIAFGPQMGGCFTGKGSALASALNVRARCSSGRFALLAKHNKALKSFVAALLTRTRGCAAGRLAWRYT